MIVLKTENLKKYYGSGETTVKALDGIDLEIEDGEFAAIVGTSGSGKSTLLHMIGGLDRPTEGKVTVSGKEIFSLKDDELTIFRRRKIGFVFQIFEKQPRSKLDRHHCHYADGNHVYQRFFHRYGNRRKLSTFQYAYDGNFCPWRI